ncbi:hypothetical protein Dimus_007584, partial [Dionaea muscipula]
PNISTQELPEEGEWVEVRRRRNSKRITEKPVRIVTVFVSNLPQEMDRDWLEYLFRRYDRVCDVFIPQKRAARSNAGFGFARFFSMEEASAAVTGMKDFCVRDHCLKVKLASFDRSRSVSGLVKQKHNRDANTRTDPRKVTGLKGAYRERRWVPVRVKANPLKDISNGGVTEGQCDAIKGKTKTYSEMLRDGNPETQERPTIKGASIGNGWLYLEAW